MLGDVSAPLGDDPNAGNTNKASMFRLRASGGRVVPGPLKSGWWARGSLSMKSLVVAVLPSVAVVVALGGVHIVSGAQNAAERAGRHADAVDAQAQRTLTL